MRSVLGSVARSLAIITPVAGSWALLLAASGALIRHGGGRSAAGVALALVAGLFLIVAAVTGTIDYADDKHPGGSPGVVPACFGFAVACITAFLGFSAVLAGHADWLGSAAVAGAVAGSGLYLLAAALRGRDRPEAEPEAEAEARTEVEPVDGGAAENRTVGELCSALQGLPDATVLRAEVVDGVVSVFAGDRFVWTS